jgi:peroxiredoxin
MNKIFAVFFFFVSVITFAQKSNVTINGELINSNYKKVTLQFVGAEIKDVTTVDVEKNKFVIKTNIEGSDLYKISFDEDVFIYLALNPGEKVTIKCDPADLPGSISIAGSVNSMLIYEADKRIRAFQNQLDSLNKVYSANFYSPKIDSIKEALILLAEKTEKNKTDFLRNFVTKNNTSIVCVFFYDMLDMDENLDVLKASDSILFKTHPNNIHVKGYHEKLLKSQSIRIGLMAPEIDLPSPEGKNIKLSSFKGKYVLIDFWASWCGPCRKESPNMVKLYDRFKDKGFEIYSVSLDKTKDAWLTAIKADNLNWTHVSDLKYWSSVAAGAYNVSSIPFTVLIDKEGKIIAKGLRGEDLEEKLSEYLK